MSSNVSAMQGNPTSQIIHSQIKKTGLSCAVHWFRAETLNREHRMVRIAVAVAAAIFLTLTIAGIYYVRKAVIEWKRQDHLFKKKLQNEIKAVKTVAEKSAPFEKRLQKTNLEENPIEPEPKEKLGFVHKAKAELEAKVKTQQDAIEKEKLLLEKKAGLKKETQKPKEEVAKKVAQEAVEKAKQLEEQKKKADLETAQKEAAKKAEEAAKQAKLVEEQKKKAEEAEKQTKLLEEQKKKADLETAQKEAAKKAEEAAKQAKLIEEQKKKAEEAAAKQAKRVEEQKKKADLEAAQKEAQKKAEEAEKQAKLVEEQKKKADLEAAQKSQTNQFVDEQMKKWEGTVLNHFAKTSTGYPQPFETLKKLNYCAEKEVAQILETTNKAFKKGNSHVLPASYAMLEKSVGPELGKKLLDESKVITHYIVMNEFGALKPSADQYKMIAYTNLDLLLKYLNTNKKFPEDPIQWAG